MVFGTYSFQLMSTRIETPVDIPILWKLQNDDCMITFILYSYRYCLFTSRSVVPALIRFIGEKFSIINTAQKKTEKDQHFPYEGIESLWVRARPLHVDVRYFYCNDHFLNDDNLFSAATNKTIRFRDKKIPRFRFMSSYVQSVVNEFALRAKPKLGEGIHLILFNIINIFIFPLRRFLTRSHLVTVIFEPGTRKFAYGTTSIPLPSESSGQERKTAFFRKDGGAPTVSSFSYFGLFFVFSSITLLSLMGVSYPACLRGPPKM